MVEGHCHFMGMYHLSSGSKSKPMKKLCWGFFFGLLFNPEDGNECEQISMELHGITSQNVILFIVATMGTSNSLMLLHERGAELSWQGRPLQPTEDTLQVSIKEVICSGNEAALSACRLETGHHCVIARDAVGVRCYQNWVSQCQPGEMNHGKKCYSLVVPSERYALEGFSHGEALRDCQSRGSQLLDITSQVRG
jgi:hypothetical protein